MESCRGRHMPRSCRFNWVGWAGNFQGEWRRVEKGSVGKANITAKGKDTEDKDRSNESGNADVRDKLPAKGEQISKPERRRGFGWELYASSSRSNPKEAKSDELQEKKRRRKESTPLRRHGQFFERKDAMAESWTHVSTEWPYAGPNGRRLIIVPETK